MICGDEDLQRAAARRGNQARALKCPSNRNGGLARHPID
jgi:hypothetical protein